VHKGTQKCVWVASRCVWAAAAAAAAEDTSSCSGKWAVKEKKEAPQYFANKGCVTHIVALPFTVKSILRQKKNYENSNISACKNIIFKKILYKKPKSFKIS
jgi:hypothetical protein